MREDDVFIEQSPDEEPKYSGPLAVLLSDTALRDIWAHADSDTSREIGGVLVGRVVTGPGGTVVEVEQAWPAKHTEASSVHVKFTHDTWEDWHDRLDRESDDVRIVGWYHSHPGLGIFLSDHDLFIQRHFFGQPWQIAIVVDPVSRDFGCFAWQNNHIVRLPEGAVYTSLPQTEARADKSTTDKAAQQPLPPAGPAPATVTVGSPSIGERIWWLGWGIALAMFIVAALQAYSAGRQAKIDRVLDELAALRREVAALEERVAKIRQPSGQWVEVTEKETLADVCKRVYGDAAVADIVMAINGVSAPPEPGARIWLPAPQALLPPGLPGRARAPTGRALESGAGRNAETASGRSNQQTDRESTGQTRPGP